MDLAPLRTASAAEVAAFFAEADPEDLVAMVAATSDDDLLLLIGRDEIRPNRPGDPRAAARVRRPGAAGRDPRDVPHRPRAPGPPAGAPRAPVRGRLHRPARAPARRGAPVDVVLRTSILRFVRLVSGGVQRRPGVPLGQARHRRRRGPRARAGRDLPVPGTDEVAVDPRALDPVDVATVLKDAPRDYLRKAMASGFRTVVLN